MASIIGDQHHTPTGYIQGPDIKGMIEDATPEIEILGLKDIVFILILGVLVVLFFYLPGVLYNAFGFNTLYTEVAIIAIFVFVIIERSTVNFLEYERGVVFRAGKFHQVAGPGWVYMIPLVDHYVRVDLRIQVHEIAPIELVTKDKVSCMVAPVVFMYVTNPRDAVINVKNYASAVLHFITSEFTTIIGSHTADYIIAHMEDITSILRDHVHHLAHMEKGWGIEVARVEIKYVKFPKELQAAMHDRAATEQLKLAAHEKADAIKIQIDAVREASSKLTDQSMTYLYLDALNKVAAGKSTKIILPMELSRLAEGIGRKTGIMSPPTPAAEAQKPVDLKQAEETLKSIFGADVVEGYKKAIREYESEAEEVERGIESKVESKAKAKGGEMNSRLESRVKKEK